MGRVTHKPITQEEAKTEYKKLTDVLNNKGFQHFVTTYVTVSHPTLGAVPFSENIYKWQVDAAKTFLKHRYLISKKTRQVGFSTLVAAYCMWRALFFPSQRIAVVSIGQRESTEFLNRIKFIYDNLPPWLKQKTSEWAKTSVTFAHNNSQINSLPNKGDPSRGSSLSLLVADEFAAYQDQGSVLASALPALSAGSLTPFSNEGLPSQFFLISTLPHTNIVDNHYLRILHQAQDNEESEFKIVDVEVDDIPHYQSKRWHNEMRETLGERIYKIEVLGEEVFESENALIPGHILEELEIIPPARVDFLYPEQVDDEGYAKDMNVFANMKEGFDEEYGYIKGLWVWNDPDPKKEYIMVCDVASGAGKDFSTVQIFEPDQNIQVAEYKGKISTELFRHIIQLLLDYYNQAKLSVERSGLGISICEYFGETENYEGFYWHKKARNSVVPGFPMVNPIRSHAIAHMETAISRGELGIRSVRLQNELRNFGLSRRNKMEAISGNDDLVMALAQYAYLQQISWAISQNSMARNLMFQDEFDAKEKEEEEKRKKQSKYYDDNFDKHDPYEEAKEYAKSLGLCISKKEGEEDPF